MVVRPGPPSCGNGKLVNEVHCEYLQVTLYQHFMI